jgi:glucosamine--fructose-6-phosphate aminotransferase (isomerizing)
MNFHQSEVKMHKVGLYTQQEIYSQPQVWLETIGMLNEHKAELVRFYRQGGYRSVLFTGCGSTYYLSLAAADLLQEVAGIQARGLPSSEVWLSTKAALVGERRTLLVAISRSGETTETLQACEVFKRQGIGAILTLSCYDRALSQLGDLNMVFPFAQEESIAQTRAFSSLYLAGVALVTLWAGRADLFEALSGLPQVGQLLLDEYIGLARVFGSNLEIDRFYFLGSGSRYGLACELSLKMKEMTLSHSEPFHFMEFRHGPKSMVTPSTLVVGLLSNSNYQQEAVVLEEMRSLGAQVLSMGEGQATASFRSGLDESIQNILYLPVGQVMAFERSIAKGLNPDLPHNLDTVVKLQLN